MEVASSFDGCSGSFLDYCEGYSLTILVKCGGDSGFLRIP